MAFWFGLVWFGLVWIDWYCGLVWFGVNKKVSRSTDKDPSTDAHDMADVVVDPETGLRFFASPVVWFAWVRVFWRRKRNYLLIFNRRVTVVNEQQCWLVCGRGGPLRIPALSLHPAPVIGALAEMEWSAV